MLGGLEVDDHLKLGWRLDRQIGRLHAFEDAVDVPRRLAEHTLFLRAAPLWDLILGIRLGINTEAWLGYGACVQTGPVGYRGDAPRGHFAPNVAVTTTVP